MKLFLDTNILIDFIIERDEFYLPAASIISYASDGTVEVIASSLTMINANYICRERCKMPEKIFRKKIDFLRTFMGVCDVNAEDIYNAYDKRWKDFEDGVQYYCANRNSSDYLVTRNSKDFEESATPAIAPDEAIGIIKTLTGKLDSGRER